MATLSTATAQDIVENQTAKRILITAPTTAQLHNIQDAGLDLHCGAKFQNEDLILDLGYEEVQIIQELGVSYDVLQEDLTKFFVDRAQNTRSQAETELALMKENALFAAQNRSSLSTGDTSIDSFIQREECSEIDWVSQEFTLGAGFGGCLTVDEMLAELDRMRALYPDIISVKADASPTGQTTYGDIVPAGGSRSQQFGPQTVYYVRISDNPDTDESNEPESLITGMTHAREVNSLMNVIYYMWWLLENYETDPAVKNLIDNQELYFIPIVNPDGVKWNEAIAPNGGGLQRKNLRPNVNDAGNTSTNNRLRGVDLNRNSSYYWGFDNSGSSPTQSADTYRGPSPASEPESQILADFVQSRELKYAINHHSGINSIVTSSYNGNPNAAPSNREDEYQKLMHDATRFNRYIHGSAPNTLTSANGDTNDYMLGGPAVTYTTFIDDDGDNFGNPATLQSYTATGSGKDIITFSPENGDDFWPPLTDITPIAQRAVRMNLLTSLYAGKYARFHDLTTTDITTTTATIDFAVEYLGQTSSDLTLEITPVSNNISGVTQPSATALSGMDILEQRDINATLMLDPTIQSDDLIEYQITLSNDSYIIYQTNIIKYYSPSVVLDADGEAGNWTLSGPWAQTTDGFGASTNAITSTPTPPYGNNVLAFATLSNPIDLSSTNSAVVQFHAKWDIERNFDLAQLEASADGGSTWTALCGKYTKVASGGPGNLHLNKGAADEAHQGNNGDLIYDGDLVLDPNTTNTNSTADDVDKWVLEEVLLDNENNSGIAGSNNVLFRFKFDTDSSNREDGYDTNFEGFTFDNFQVSVIEQDTDICDEVVREFPQTASLETDLGIWTQNTDDDGNWVLDTNGTPTGGTGPDAANDGGQYLYLESSDPAAVNDPNAIGFDATAILTSSCLDVSDIFNLELSFTYHMFGENTGSLQVEVLPNGETEWELIPESIITGEQQNANSDDWLTQRINLSNYNGQVIQVRIVGTTGDGFRSDIAIDNLILSTPCATTTTYTSSGWSNGIPEDDVTAIIASNYDTASSGSITACSLTIESGATLTVNDNSFVSIENDITVNGILDVSNTGSVVQVSEMAVTRNNGTINVAKTTPSLNPRDFIILSSPMSGESRTEVFADANRVFGIIAGNFVPNADVSNEFPMAANFIDDNGDFLDNAIGALAPSSGYLVFPQAVSDTDPAIFEHTYTNGTLNSGTIVAPITYNSTTSTDNFNLLGNPYASAIDTDMLIATNDVINEVYFWEHITTPNQSLPGFNTSNFSMDDVSLRNAMMGVPAVNDVTASAPGQYMASGQGFGILANGAEQAAGTDVSFTNALRVTGNNSTPRSAELDNKLWLQLSTENYDIQSTAALGFIPEATPEFDLGYDSRQLATSISLFSTLDSGEQLAIQGRELFNSDIEITLGFQTLLEEAENYTISIHQLEGIDLSEADVFLTDHITGSITNLKENNYSFTASMITQERRFTLRFTESVLNVEELSQNELRLYPNPTKDMITLQSNGTSNLEQLIIRDMLGKLIRNIDLSVVGEQQTFDISQLETGVYFFQITTNSSSQSIRVIKY